MTLRPIVLFLLCAAVPASARDLDCCTAPEAGAPDMQRAWVAFCDAGCGSEGATFRDGMMPPVVPNHSVARLTLARIEGLRTVGDTEDTRAWGDEG